MSTEPRLKSIEELRLATPPQVATYLGALAAASLQANMQRFAAEEAAAAGAARPPTRA